MQRSTRKRIDFIPVTPYRPYRLETGCSRRRPSDTEPRKLIQSGQAPRVSCQLLWSASGSRGLWLEKGSEHQTIFPGSPSGQSARGWVRTCDRTVHADLRVDSISTWPPTVRDWHATEQDCFMAVNIDKKREESSMEFVIVRPNVFPMTCFCDEWALVSQVILTIICNRQFLTATDCPTSALDI
ncbi:hypothetical protein PoB_001603300 [Plakobranchus ocellatus]|uniref:Uncharacterized protein n=1 Tax=Plakobranchus ocellatus TaxID=259542 RepID=A0AAV3Z4Z6_9GAST|nr:hypothetical protein PoB_001603300 [Plakobranchus ocellatus]